MKSTQFLLLASLAWCVAACGGKDKQADKPADTAKTETKANAKPAQKPTDSPKYQEAVKALNPSFKLLKLPLKLNFDDFSTGTSSLQYGEVSINLLEKHLGYKPMDNDGSFPPAAIGRVEGPDGDTRYIISMAPTPVTEVLLLYAFDPEKEEWREQNTRVMSMEDTDQYTYQEAVLNTDGSVDLTKFSMSGEPYNPEQHKGKVKTDKETWVFKGGQWSKN